MDKKPNEIYVNLIPTKINKSIYVNLIPTKINNYTVQYNSYTTINTLHNWQAFLAASCLNIGYISSYALI